MELLQRVQSHALLDPAAARQGVRFRQTGAMKLTPGGSWKPFVAGQTMTVDPPGFDWQARVRMAPLLTARIHDHYDPTGGSVQARLWAMKIADGRGPEVDVGALMRWLAELPWCPAGYAASCIAWSTPEPTVLRASASVGSARAEVDFTVTADGRIEKVRAVRPRQVGKTFVLTPWGGDYSGESEVHGLRVPTSAEVSWFPPEGPFLWWRATVDELRPL